MAVYYIDFLNGSDECDGLSAKSAKKTQGTVELCAGDTLLFKRGTLFRGKLNIVAGEENSPICYGAYGEGSEPIFCGSADVSKTSLWKLTDRENVWECIAEINGDVGNFVFDGECSATFRWNEKELSAQGDFFDSRFADGEQRKRIIL